MSKEARKAPGLYIHIPLCLSKCRYCDFFSVTDNRRKRKIVEAIGREATLYDDLFPDSELDTIYIGGGTPSLLDDAELGNLFAAIGKSFAITETAEVTLEANPDDVTPDRLDAWRDAGVNRLSLGVQSLDDKELALLGRRHTARGARKAFEQARAAGFDNISVDLIFGCPPGHVEAWKRTLESTLELHPEHLSCYQLTIEDRTPLGRQRKNGRFLEIGEEQARDLFLTTHDMLRNKGYEHYEISSYARGQTYRSQHNQKYWQRVPYLGLGPSAHSFDGRKRWWNGKNIEAYLTALSGSKISLPTATKEQLTADQEILEKLMLGFRTSSGFDLSIFHQQPGWMSICDELLEEGLIRFENKGKGGERIVPTVLGFLVADGLPLRFFGSTKR